MPYDVTLHPGGQAAFVYRREAPRCLLTFTRTATGSWEHASTTWFEETGSGPPEEAIRIEALGELLRLEPGPR